MSRERIVAHQLERLNAPGGLALLRQRNAFCRARLEELTLPLPNLHAWFQVPFTTKDALVQDQAAHPPHGSNLTYPAEAYTRVHSTSGTTGRKLKVLDTPESWSWFVRCWERIYAAIGIGVGDRVFAAFGFGPFIGFWAGYEAAPRVGARAIPAGAMSSRQRLDWLIESDATVLLSTPTYALRLAEVAKEAGVDLAASSIRATVHAGEPGASIPATRALIEAAFGARVWDHAGMSEVGAWGYECPAGQGMHLLEDEFIAEVLKVGRDEPVAEGESGELVLTNLGRWAAPALRYRTGDLVLRVTEPTPCECGSNFIRFPGGVLGRVDDMVQVRGVNIYPGAVESIVREEPAVAEFQVELYRRHSMWEMKVRVELTPDVGSDRGAEAGAEAKAVRERLSRELENRLLVRAEVELAPPESLPRFELKARRFNVRRGEGSNF